MEKEIKLDDLDGVTGGKTLINANKDKGKDTKNKAVTSNIMKEQKNDFEAIKNGERNNTIE